MLILVRVLDRSLVSRSTLYRTQFCGWLLDYEQTTNPFPRPSHLHGWAIGIEGVVEALHFREVLLRTA